jgi:hypothetical protein
VIPCGIWRRNIQRAPRNQDTAAVHWCDKHTKRSRNEGDSAEGDDWRRKRGVIAHALDVSHLREFFPTLIKVTGIVANALQLMFWPRAHALDGNRFPPSL